MGERMLVFKNVPLKRNEIKFIKHEKLEVVVKLKCGRLLVDSYTNDVKAAQAYERLAAFMWEGGDSGEVEDGGQVPGEGRQAVLGNTEDLRPGKTGNDTTAHRRGAGGRGI